MIEKNEAAKKIEPDQLCWILNFCHDTLITCCVNIGDASLTGNCMPGPRRPCQPRIPEADARSQSC